MLAVAPSAAYRARKFARRYRAALATLCAFVVVLVVAAGVSICESVIANRQRDRADAEAAVATAVNQFLQDDLLSQANPESQGGAGTKPDPDVKALTLLDRAASKVGKGSRTSPWLNPRSSTRLAKPIWVWVFTRRPSSISAGPMN